MNPKGVAVDAYGGKYSLPNDKSTFEDFINYIVGHGDDAVGKVSEGDTQAKTKQVKKGLPDWLKERFNQGNQFNKDNRPRYEYNEVRVTKDGSEFRVDSYNRNSEIVSRKFTQLGEIK